MEVSDVFQAAELVSKYGGFASDRPAALLMGRPTELQLEAAKQNCIANVERAFALLKERFDKAAREESEEIQPTWKPP